MKREFMMKQVSTKNNPTTYGTEGLNIVVSFEIIRENLSIVKSSENWMLNNKQKTTIQTLFLSKLFKIQNINESL